MFTGMTEDSEKSPQKGINAMNEIQPNPGSSVSPGSRHLSRPLMEKARELEAVFLNEMLAQGGLGTAPESFGGGIGEEQFASFLRAEQANLMVDRGGIGLAETLFRAMGGSMNDV